MSKWRVSGLVLGGFTIVALLAYAPAIGGPFQYDDKRVILDAQVRDNVGAWGYGGVWGTRGLVHASFWADWRLWGENTVPYHLENIAIHVLASYLVFLLLRQLKFNVWASGFGAAVFLLHPIQSQAVAYISQRFESMAAMFYLLTVVLYLKGKRLMALGAYLLALSSKEIAVTLPVTLLLLEAMVIRRKLKVKDWVMLGMFFLVTLKIPLQVIGAANLGGQVPSVQDVVNQAAAVERPAEFGLTRTNYALTQVNVVKTYLRLVALPVRQSLDYDYALTNNFFEWPTPLSAAMLIGLVGIGIYTFRKKPLVSLGIGWWFISLSISSSIIPIRDVIYEHRVYLPLVGFIIVLCSLMRRKWLIWAGPTLLAIYFVLTLFRANVWASEVNLWRDVWLKAPEKHRANKNYGFVLTQVPGGLKEGIERLEYAVKLNPEDQDYRITLGGAYLQAQAWDKARIEFEEATKLPTWGNNSPGTAWNNLGVALFQLQRYPEAKQAFAQALELDSNFQMAWLGLGGAETVLGNVNQAEVALERAIALLPDDPRAYSNVVTLYIKIQNWDKALEAIDRLERVDAKYPGIAEKRQAVIQKLKQGE